MIASHCLLAEEQYFLEVDLQCYLLFHRLTAIQRGLVYLIFLSSQLHSSKCVYVVSYMKNLKKLQMSDFWSWVSSYEVVHM